MSTKSCRQTNRTMSTKSCRNTSHSTLSSLMLLLIAVNVLSVLENIRSAWAVVQGNVAIICSSEEIAGKLVLQASKAVRAVCGFSSALLHCKCHRLYSALAVALGSVSKSKYKSNTSYCNGLKSFSQSLVMFVFAGISIPNLAARFYFSPNRNRESRTTASRAGKNTLSLKQRTSVDVLNILYLEDCF